MTLSHTGGSSLATLGLAPFIVYAIFAIAFTTKISFAWQETPMPPEYQLTTKLVKLPPPHFHLPLKCFLTIGI